MFFNLSSTTFTQYSEPLTLSHFFICWRYVTAKILSIFPLFKEILGLLRPFTVMKICLVVSFIPLLNSEPTGTNWKVALLYLLSAFKISLSSILTSIRMSWLHFWNLVEIVLQLLSWQPPFRVFFFCQCLQLKFHEFSWSKMSAPCPLVFFNLQFFANL